MIVSALLTSVGINFGLCILFFTLYSILRKQPGNVHVYLPRLVVANAVQRSRYFLQRLIPSSEWVKAAWRLSEEELLLTSGLDAVVFIRIITFSLKVFIFAGAIGVFILLPINAAGTEVETFNIAIFSSVKLDLFTISNVDDGSSWLWVHCFAVYLVTAFVCFLLYQEYDYICKKRVAYFLSSRPQPQHFTVLVRGIPGPSGSSISESVDKFFTKYHPSTYLSHVVIHRTNKLWHLVKAYEKYSSYSLTQPNKVLKVKLNLKRHWEICRRTYEKRIYEKSGHMVSLPCESRYGAATAAQLQQSENPTIWVTEQAPDPNDVYWPFFIQLS